MLARMVATNYALAAQAACCVGIIRLISPLATGYMAKYAIGDGLREWGIQTKLRVFPVMLFADPIQVFNDMAENPIHMIVVEPYNVSLGLLCGAPHNSPSSNRSLLWLGA